MLKHNAHDLYDCTLCLLLSASLTCNVTEGFLLPERLCGAWVPIFLLSAAVTAVCAVISWSDCLRKPFLIGTAVIVSAILTYCIFAGIPLSETADPERNTGLWALIVIGCSLAVRLLGRTKSGAGVLAVCGTLLHCGVSVLEFPFSPAALLIFLVCAGLLFALRGTERNGASFSVFLRHIRFQLVIGLGALACAAILCFGVLIPLRLPTADLRLFTKLVSPEILTQAGLIDDTLTIPEGSNSSSAAGSVSGDSANPENSDPSAGRADQMPTDDGGGITRYLNQVSVPNRFLLGMLLIDLLLLLLFFRRRLCLLRLLRKTPDEQLHLLYHMILREFILLGLPVQGSDTPAEYAARIRLQTDAFDVSAPDWETLTARYIRFCYAGEPADCECITAFRIYYLSLPNLLLWKLNQFRRQNF